MYRESEFEKTIKWFLVGTAGLCALCHFIMLFYEISFFKGVGVLFNILFHLIGIGSPILIVFLFIKKADDKEVYSNYAIALNIFSTIIIDLVLIIQYILQVNTTDGFNLGIVIGYFLLILCESITVWLFIKYGLDKVTCVLPLISIVVICVFRGGMLGAVDSGLSTYAYSSVKGSVFSIWTFMYLMFFVAMVVCLVLYLDSDFLYDTIKNPKELFTKKTILGTYTNLYLDEKPIDSFQKNAEQLSNSIGICEECGNPIYLGQTICNNCGCPITQIKQDTSTIENTENIDKNEISSNIQEDFDNLQDKESNNICPDCKSIVYPGQSICTNCGCPIKSDHQEEQNYDSQRNDTSFTNSIKGDIYPNTIKEATNNEYSVNNKKPQWLFVIFVIVAVVIFFVSRSGVLHYSTGKVLFQAERIRLVNDRDECLKGAEEYKGTKWEAEYKSVADTDQSNIKICDEQIKNHETKENICLWIERISIILGLCFFVAFVYSLIKE